MVEDDDDDISLVSRSPSPMNDGMDIDHEDTVSKYDEFLRKPILEPVTVDTKINSSNIGFALLAKMGWSEGQSLGLSGDGRIDPIPFELKQDTLGIGRATQESMIAAEAVAARRVLDSERQIQETEEQRQARENQVARKAAVQDEISNTLRAFYCSLCDKQFQNVAQYDEHTNSYAHHHKARFRDMQANARIKPQEDVDKRKEKERKREERELRKIAAAAGIKMPKAAGPQTGSSASAPEEPVSMDVETSSLTQKKGGWASIGTGPSTQTTGVKKSGWATVSSSGSTTPPPPPTPTPSQSSGWAPVSSFSSTPDAPSSGQHHMGHTPSFRTGGWTSLDTGTATTITTITDTITTQPPPPHSTPTPVPAAPSGSPQPPPSSGFRPVQQPNTGSSQTNQGGWPSIPPATSASTPPPPTSNAQSHFQSASASNTSGPPIPKPTSSISAGASSRASEPSAEPQRSGWQKFQAKNTKRR